MKIETKLIQEIVISLTLIGLLVFLLNPTHILMPTSLQNMLLVVLSALFILFLSFFWRENSADEREKLHKYIAGRFAFLVGVGVLVVGVIFQTLSHEVDPWLIIALVAIVLSKIAALIYNQFKH